MSGVSCIRYHIKIISLVERFLELPRIILFENGGVHKIYISSADWMTRNMDYRIEVGCPVNDADARQMIIDILELQFEDTLKARVIDEAQSNAYVKRGNRKKLRSQIQIHQYLSAKEAK